MDFIKEHGYGGRKINDCHYHIGRQYPNRETSELLLKHRQYLNLEKMLLLSLTDGMRTCDPSANVKALFHKEDDKDNMYSFASLHHYYDERDNEENYLKQIKFFREVGFDGMKMLEGKGEYRHLFTQKLDSDVYRSFFKFAEETEFPILIHVGDIPSDDEQKELYDGIIDEMEYVLKCFPKLHITFAHLLFLWKDKARLERILDTYENTSLDLAIGGSFVLYFSKDIDSWREFFTKYCERILFATDNWNTFFEGDDDFEVSCRHTPVRSFLESKTEFTTKIFGPKNVVKPLLAPSGVAENILRKNFVRLFGEKPRGIDYSLALEYAQWLLDCYMKGELKTYNKCEEMPSWYTEAEKKNLLRANDLAIENLEEIICCYNSLKER